MVGKDLIVLCIVIIHLIIRALWSMKTNLVWGNIHIPKNQSFCYLDSKIISNATNAIVKSFSTYQFRHIGNVGRYIILIAVIGEDNKKLLFQITMPFSNSNGMKWITYLRLQTCYMRIVSHSSDFFMFPTIAKKICISSNK